MTLDKSVGAKHEVVLTDLIQRVSVSNKMLPFLRYLTFEAADTNDLRGVYQFFFLYRGATDLVED